MREEELLDHINHVFSECQICAEHHNYECFQCPKIKTCKQAYRVIKKLIQVDPDEIIQAVLDHAKCNHIVSKDEDGFHVSDEYNVKKGCHEAVRKVLGVGE